MRVDKIVRNSKWKALALAKRAAIPGGAGLRPVLAGPARGLRLHVDPLYRAPLLFGLVEVELARFIRS